MNNRRQLLILATFATACTVLMLATVVYSGTLLVQHWSLAMTPCVECSKTFWQHILVPSNIAASVFFVWSALGLLRGGVFLWREYHLQKYTRDVQHRPSIILVDNAPLAAWTGGIVRQSIFVNTSFWHSLDVQEQIALREHEQHHVDERESLLFFVLGWCRSIIFLPGFTNGIHAFLEEKRVQSELCADAKAMQATSSLTLASLLRKALSFEQAYCTSVAPAINSFIALRIEHMSNPGNTAAKQPNGQWLLVSTLACVGGVIAWFFFYFEPIHGCL